MLECEKAETEIIDRNIRIAKTLDAMSLLSDDERMEVMHNFCLYCGTDYPDCQCWNDE